MICYFLKPYLFVFNLSSMKNNNKTDLITLLKIKN